MKEPDPTLDATAAEQLLLALERELERSSVVRPPADEALDRWQQQAEDLRVKLVAETLPGRNRLVRIAERFLGELQDVRERKARYIQRRERRVVPLSDPDRSVAWLDLPGGHARSSLAAGVREGLQSAAVSVTSRTLEHSKRAAESPIGDKVSELPAALGSKPDSANQPAVQPAVGIPASVPTKKESQRVALHSPPPDPVDGLPFAQRPRLSWRLDPIVAVVGRLARPDSFSEAHAIALKWLRGRGLQPPRESGQDFEIQATRGHTATAVSLPERGVWALKAETADPELSGRRWRVEMVLVDTTPTPAVSITLTASSPAGAPEPPTSIPRLVTDLSQKIGLIDTHHGVLFGEGPLRVDDADGLESVLALLAEPNRTRPVLVLSTYRKDGQLKQILDPDGTSAKLAGLAQVVVLSRDMVWPFNEVVGRDFAVRGASMRLYRPGFSPEDDPGRHPYWSPIELVAQGWTLRQLSDELLREAAYLSLRALEREDAILAFDRVREMVLERRIEEARQKALQSAIQRADQSDSAWLKEQLESETSLRVYVEQKNSKLQQELSQEKQKNQQILDERDLLSGKVRYLESRVQQLQTQARESRVQVEPEYPDTWDDLDDWCYEHLAGRVILTPKAVRSAKDSSFADIPFVYRVLWCLAEHYVPGRRNGSEDYKLELAALGLDDSKVGNASKSHRSKSTYETDFGEERLPLDMHITGSNSRDRRYGFRLYYHWHEGNQCMVVGSLPEHLPNALS